MGRQVWITMNRTLLTFFKKIAAMLIVLSIVPVVAAYGWFSSSASGIEFSQPGDLPLPYTAKSDDGGGNSGGNSGGSASGGGNSGGNSGGSDSGGGNSGGNSGGSDSGGNSGGNSGGSDSGGGNTGGNSGSKSGDDSKSGSDNTGTDKGKSETGTNNNAEKAGGAPGNSNAGGNVASPDTKTDLDRGISLGISGSQINSRENSREISIDTQKAKDAGEKISVEGSTITFSKGPMSIGVTTATDPKETDGVITADIKSISIEHQPVTAQLKDTGTVSVSFKADLTSLPPTDATITAVIAETPGPATQVAIDQAVTEQGYQLDAIAYTMDVTKTNLDDGKDIGPATVTMSVTPSWVANHGGVDGVKIARFADDGTSQLLETWYIGPDSSANMVFAGSSPGGLSIFSLISVKAHAEAIAPSSQPAPAAPGSLPFNGAMDAIRIATPLIVLGIFLMFRKKYFFKE